MSDPLYAQNLTGILLPGTSLGGELLLRLTRHLDFWFYYFAYAPGIRPMVHAREV